jgi:4-amino-4-deoxy-L-arabinose transferase-like glycosyltransferase
LYPLLIGVTSLFSRDFELAGRLVSMAAGSLLVIPVYLLARRLYGKTEAGIAALLTAICPTLVFSSTRVLSESLFTLLFTVAVLATLSACTGERRRLFFLAGAGFGACYLVKPEAIGFGVLVVFLAASRKVFNRNADVRSVLAGALLAALGCAVVSLPYILYLRSETGSWTISQKLTASFGTSEAGNKWRGLIENGQTTMADKVWAGRRSSTVASVGAVESGDLRSTARKSLQLPRPRSVVINLYREYESFFMMMTPLLFFLTGLGLLGTGWSRDRAKQEVYLLLFVFSMALGYAAAGFENRYFEALCPVWIVWSSRGLVGLERRLCAIEQVVRRSAGFLRKHRTGLRAVLLICLAVSLAPSLRSGAAVESDAGPQIALWIKRDSEPSLPLIMASDPRMAFYSGGKHLYIPTEEYEVVLDYANRMGVDYLVVE